MLKLSIIVPTFNDENRISKCLESLINQDFDSYEIIIVNDGSNDGTEKVIKAYQKNNPKLIKYHYQDNAGQGSARNFGLSIAKGEYIGFVDSDDYVEKDMFSKLYKKAIKNDSDIVICGAYEVSEDFEILKTDMLEFSLKQHNCKTNPYILFDKTAPWNKIYKKSLLIENKIFFRSKKWYEDFDFSLKALILAKRIDFVNKPLYNYVIRQSSTMNNKNAVRNLEIIEAFDSIAAEKYIAGYDKELEYLFLKHGFFAAICRVVEIGSNGYKEIANQIRDYCLNKYPNMKNNIYVERNFKNKLLFFLIDNKLYFLLKILLKVKRRMK